MSPSSEHQVAAMRGAVQAAGSASRSVRILLALGGGAALLVLVGVLLAGELWKYLSPDLQPSLVIFVKLVALAPVALAVGSLGGTALSRSYRAAHLRRLRGALATLSPEERRQALLPLLTDAIPDTRELAQPLLRDGELNTELTPTAAPEGRGDEPSPATDFTPAPPP